MLFASNLFFFPSVLRVCLVKEANLACQERRESAELKDRLVLKVPLANKVNVVFKVLWVPPVLPVSLLNEVIPDHLDRWVRLVPVV